MTTQKEKMHESTKLKIGAQPRESTMPCQSRLPALTFEAVDALGLTACFVGLFLALFIAPPLGSSASGMSTSRDFFLVSKSVACFVGLFLALFIAPPLGSSASGMSTSRDFFLVSKSVASFVELFLALPLAPPLGSSSSKGSTNKGAFSVTLFLTFAAWGLTAAFLAPALVPAVFAPFFGLPSSTSHFLPLFEPLGDSRAVNLYLLQRSGKKL